MSDINATITAVKGIQVGHAQDMKALTGCTVVICRKGAVAGVDQRGGAPGTRETDLLQPMHLVQKVHAIVLAGGSAFGLDASSGVMKYLEEKGVGFNSGFGKIPIVPSAILFDLGIGDPKIRPDFQMGYQACINASEKPVSQGNIGAGTGATVGKILGMPHAMKSGIGSSSICIGDGITVGAIIAVNAFGDIVDPNTGTIVAGARSIQKGLIMGDQNQYFVNTIEFFRTLLGKSIINFASRQNTVIGVVATDACLSKEGINKVAQMAQDGLARTIRPAHTMFDGDTLFALSTGIKKCDINIIGAYAALMVEKAILSAVYSAEAVAGLPSAS